ncbi:hypothetical protein [Rhizobium changzhiense]|uniref:hypothetical protein n=1 Tax=Rhizobium changzhiense TaxID=2692317 RepID=UPI001FEE8AB1|nr:hypothetical protein [Rhizobium changzhiense]
MTSGEQSAAWQERIQKLCSEMKECVYLYPGSNADVRVSKMGEHFDILNESIIDAFP